MRFRLTLSLLPSSKPKTNLRFTIASIVVSILGLLSPVLGSILIGILLAGFAIYRSHRSKGGWIALALGIILFTISQYVSHLSLS